MRTLLTVLLLAGAACGGCPQAAGSPLTSSSPAACTGSDGQRFNVTSAAGYTRPAAVYGSGPTVILAHQSDETGCDMVPYARWLRDNHYQAVVVNLAGDWTGILAATIKAMREKGSASIQLIGGSMGGNVSMIVASQVSPPVSSVISLGGERRLGPEYDADAAVAKSHVPLFIITSENDGFLLAPEAKILIAESASKDKQSLILSGDLHGFAMLDGPDGTRVKTAILDFLARHSQTN